jgi:hypothetical protein
MTVCLLLALEILSPQSDEALILQVSVQQRTGSGIR